MGTEGQSRNHIDLRALLGRRCRYDAFPSLPEIEVHSGGEEIEDFQFERRVRTIECFTWALSTVSLGRADID